MQRLYETCAMCQNSKHVCQALNLTYCMETDECAFYKSKDEFDYNKQLSMIQKGSDFRSVRKAIRI